MIELTENLLYKLEEKVVSLMEDSEKQRDLVHQLQSETAKYRDLVQTLQSELAGLKQEKETNTRKLKDLLSLLDSVNPLATEQPAYAYAEPVMAQA